MKPVREQQVEEKESAYLRAAIAKLFADARDCVDHECSALVEWHALPDRAAGHCVFECICSVPDNRHDVDLHDPRRHYIPYGPTRDQGRAALALVKQLFPDHENQRVLFRSGPHFEYRTPDCALPSLWLRLGAVPLDVNEFVVRS